MKNTFALFSLLLVVSAFGQNPVIDSTFQELAKAKTAKDSAEVLQGIGYAYIFVNPDSAKYFTELAYTMSSEQRDTYQMAFCHNNWGVLYTVSREFDKASENYRTGIRQLNSVGEERQAATLVANLAIMFEYRSQLDSAIFYNEQAMQVERQAEDLDGIGKIELNIGTLYLKKGYYHTALDHYFTALDIFEKHDSTHFQQTAKGHLYYNVCNCLMELEEYDRAISFCEKAGQQYEKLNLPRGKAGVESTLGYLLGKKEQPEAALEKMKTALALAKQVGELNLQAELYSNMGTVFNDLGQPDSALTYISQGIELAEKGGDLNMLAFLQAAQGEVFFSMKNYRAAIAASEAAIQTARRAGMVKVIPEAFENIAKAHRATGDLRSALDAQENFAVAKDSLLSREKQVAIAEAEIKYQTLQQEKENVRLQAEQELNLAKIESQHFRTKLLGVLAAVFGIGLLLFLWLNRKLKNERDKNATLLTEAYHTTKNHLATLVSMIRMQGRRLKDLQAKELFQDNESRVEAIQQIHQRLLRNESGHASVQLNDYLPKIAENILKLYRSEEDFKVKLTSNVQPLEANHKLATALGLVANELLTNACKYAFPKGHQDPKIGLEVKSENGQLRMTVQDNGQGLPEAELPKSASYGMELVSLFLENINAKMTVKNDGGARFDIIAPMKN